MRVIFFYHSDSLCFDDDLDFRKDKFGNQKYKNLLFFKLVFFGVAQIHILAWNVNFLRQNTDGGFFLKTCLPLFRRKLDFSKASPDHEMPHKYFFHWQTANDIFLISVSS